MWDTQGRSSCAAFLSNIFGGAKILAGCRAEVLAPRISFCEANAVFLAKQNTDGVLQKKRECFHLITLAFLRFHFSLCTSVEGACTLAELNEVYLV